MRRQWVFPVGARPVASRGVGERAVKVDAGAAPLSELERSRELAALQGN